MPEELGCNLLLTMITKSTNETIMVFVTPDKLREIAGCLERQEQRAKDQTGLSPGSSINVIEGLDSLHTQLHSGEITVWFRNPVKEERDVNYRPQVCASDWAD